ncbi:MAG TPA: DUF4058 family protein [Verrucomicrobiota bacterium]|nr:DUF4058 family protein [Verrucomicrobiota bacterium]HRZ37396.1 DUF4058 family protein [Candidatus Paceibacterota bacterium]
MMTKNPFPGMNPFFQQRWRDAHTMLVAYCRDALQERLPADLVAGAEEETVVIGADEHETAYRPDVQVREPWRLQEPAAAAVAVNSSIPPGTEPLRVLVEDEIERWIEIRDTTGRLVTALEWLSPSNKLETEERERFHRRRRRFLSGGASVVEMDLVRQGAWLFPEGVRRALRGAGATYGVCVFRAGRTGECEVYPIRLRDRLPCLRIPLRPTDADVALDLQPLIDQCHERGRYHLLDYRFALDPPLAPEDAAWAEHLLREGHLI